MKAMAPSSASFFDLYSRTANPPTTSLASVKGPSIARTCPFESRTRVLVAVEASPPLTTIVPALTASSPSFAITSMNPLGGGPWFSECLTIIMNRITTPLLCIFVFALQGCISGRLRPGGQPCSTVTSNTSPRNRQLDDLFQDRGAPRLSQLDRRGLLNARVRFIDLAKLAFTITNNLQEIFR